MIKINLLPDEALKKPTKRRAFTGPKPSVLIVLILVAAYLGAIAIGGGVFNAWWTAKKELETATEKRDEILKQIEDVKGDFVKLKELEDLLKNQVEILKALDPPGRILWSEKLNMLASMIPPDVYITKMEKGVINE